MKTLFKNVFLIFLSITLAVSLCYCTAADTNSIPSGSDGNSEVSNSNVSDTTTENNSSEDTISDNSNVIGTMSGENGDTTISTTSPTTPTESETTNTDGNHTITVNYQWHPGLPNVDVEYPFTVKVDGDLAPAGSYTVSSTVSGITLNGNKLSVSYSARAQGKPIVVTVKHKSGAKCDISVPCFKWTQTFNDDFNGTELDRTKWKEHWYFTSNAPSDAASYEVIDRAKPAKDCYTVSDGKLNMLIKAEPTYDTTNKIKYLYSECCLDTAGRFEQTYGLFQANIASAKFSGINTAFWLLPKGSYSKFYTNFLTEDPRYGLAEIDIYESSVAFGNYNRRTFAISEHFYDYTNNYKAGHKRSAYYQLDDPITNFHTYSCVWTPDALYYYVNDKLIRSSTGIQETSYDGRSVEPAYMIVDVSLYLDNAWVGKRDFKASDLPIAGYVDWARAYKYN